MQLLLKLSDDIDDLFEIPKIIYQLKQIENLKQVLFSQEQIALFEYISEDVRDIKGNRIYPRENDINNEKLWSDKMRICWEYKNKLEENQEISSIDKRLLNRLDDRFDNLDFTEEIKKHKNENQINKIKRPKLKKNKLNNNHSISIFRIKK